jgi:CheY-like chemotaxis protein
MKQRILLADDNEDILDIFREGLELQGFEVIPVSTVNEALRHISTEHFDVLLSDLHMPDAGDGFTIVSAMRHAHPSAVTLVLTGYPRSRCPITPIQELTIPDGPPTRLQGETPRAYSARTCTSGGHSGSNTMFIVFHSPSRSSSSASRGIHGLNSYPIVRPGQGRYW